MFFLITLIVAWCSIIYEILLSTLSSYLIWNSILQFSLTIGFFLFWLWIGSNLSKYIKKSLDTFINIEVLLWILGWLSVIIIKLAYINLADYDIIFNLFYLLFVITIWLLTWFEIPLISDIISKITQNKDIKNIIWDVFSYDYIWALIATLAFPFLFLPYFWLTYSAIIVGLLNLIAALLFLVHKPIKEIFIKEKKYTKSLIKIFIWIVILFWWFIFSASKFENIWDHFFYREPILLKTHSPYQQIVITKRWNDIRLLLDWHLQFLSLDEHRYHNSLYSQAKNYLTTLNWPKNILILGWGDGLLARNIIKSLSGQIFKITLVDLDPKITNLAKTFPILVKLNKNSLNNPNLKVINQDAFKFLLKTNTKYNVIIADFPDPRNIELAKLYSKEFYLLVKKHLKPWWIFTTQAGNAFFTKESFWCIYKTIKSIWENPFAYHSYIPSFWDWWFIGFKKWGKISQLTWTYILTNFDKDYKVNLNKIKENTLDNEIIVNYYIKWRKRFTE